MKSVIIATAAALVLAAAPAWADTDKAEATEAQALKAWPKLAQRDGNSLTLLHNGQPVAHHNNFDCSQAGFEGDACELWFFSGPIRLLSKTSGHLETYAQAFVAFYEGEGAVIADENGVLLTMDTLGVASPDGKIVVSGKSETDDANDSFALTIYDWTGKAKPVRFEPSCQPLKWLSNTRFTVRCARLAASAERFDGKVSRAADGTWQLKQTQLLDHTTLQPLPKAQQTLKTFAAKPAA